MTVCSFLFEYNAPNGLYTYCPTLILHDGLPIYLHAHELIWTGGDVHLYLNPAELVEAQLARVPAGSPKLRILRRPASIFDYRFEDFAVENYAPQAHIAAPVAV